MVTVGKFRSEQIILYDVDDGNVNEITVEQITSSELSPNVSLLDIQLSQNFFHILQRLHYFFLYKLNFSENLSNCVDVEFLILKSQKPNSNPKLILLQARPFKLAGNSSFTI